MAKKITRRHVPSFAELIEAEFGTDVALGAMLDDLPAAVPLRPCEVEGCTATSNHHHLGGDERHRNCDGVLDEYGRSPACCQLSPTWAPRPW